MLQRYQMEDCKPVDTPMAFGRTEDSSMQLEEKNAQLFRSILGSLMYVMVCTRPDIGFAVSSLSKHMNNPQHQHLVAAKRVLRYLKGTRTTGLQYSGGTDMNLTGYSDADWAGDVTSRRSISGYIFICNGSAISWKSSLQATVALSTAEAEYMALSSATQEAIFLRQLLQELHCEQKFPTMIYKDNQSCIHISRNKVSNGRTKHIDIKYNFTRERIEKGEVQVQYLCTDEMLADILTKPLPLKQHTNLCAFLFKYKRHLSSGGVKN